METANITRTYTHTVPTLCVFVKGRKDGPHRISAPTIEDGEKTIMLKDASGGVIGSFDKMELAGWWIEPDVDFGK